MHHWPFDTITPEQLDALTAAEREGLEAIAATFIKAVLRNRGVEAPPADPADLLVAEPMGKPES